jgi:hypothetical protein
MCVITRLAMKKLVIILLVLAVLVIVNTGLPVLAQPTHLSHENPDTVVNLLDKAGLMLSYVHINNLASTSQFQSAQDKLKELYNTDIPPDIRYIMSQYNVIYQKLFTTQNNLESLLNEASALLDRNQIDEARNRLDSTSVYIKDATLLLKDVSIATNSLSSGLGVFTTTATDQLTQAHARLDDSISKLTASINNFDNIRQNLTKKYLQMIKFIPTEISLDATPLTAFVGDYITASGRLSSNGKPLSRKEIILTLEYEVMENTKKNIMVTATTNTSTTTGSDGSYFTDITIPYEYVDNMTLTAVYDSPSNDVNNYIASQSQPMTINTLFYHTRLKVTTPERLYWELPSTISGEVITDNASVSRNINVHLEGTPVVEETVSGTFNLEITPSENSTPGKRNLTVAVTPEGRYSGASRSRSITISIMPVHIETRITHIIFLPGTIKVSGRVYNELGPIADTPVSLKLENSPTTVATAPDGSFNTFTDLHILPTKAPSTNDMISASKSSTKPFFYLAPLGMHEIEITVKQLEPWATAVSEKRRILTINPLSAGLVLVIFIVVVIVIYRRNQIRVSRQKAMSPVDSLELPTITPLHSPASKQKLTAIKSRILSAYRSGLSVVEKITGIIMAPHITLREFLKMANLPSPTVTERFTELTAITESTLYSAQEPPKDTVARAEELAATIKEELRSGNP